MTDVTWAVKVKVNGTWCWLRASDQIASDYWRRTVWPQKDGAKGAFQYAIGRGYLRKDTERRFVKVTRKVVATTINWTDAGKHLDDAIASMRRASKSLRTGGIDGSPSESVEPEVKR